MTYLLFTHRNELTTSGGGGDDTQEYTAASDATYNQANQPQTDEAQEDNN